MTICNKLLQQQTPGLEHFQGWVRGTNLNFICVSTYVINEVKDSYWDCQPCPWRGFALQLIRAEKLPRLGCEWPPLASGANACKHGGKNAREIGLLFSTWKQVTVTQGDPIFVSWRDQGVAQRVSLTLLPSLAFSSLWSCLPASPFQWASWWLRCLAAPLSPQQSGRCHRSASCAKCHSEPRLREIYGESLNWLRSLISGGKC